MTHDKSTALRIFLSSPSDVLPERNRAEAIIRKISAELSNIELQPVRWEDSYYTADKSFQEQIIKPSDCDLVVCLFWSRLGSELPPMFNRADGSGRTGTEWEFEEALDAARNREPILPDLLVYKKTIEPQFKASEAELGLAQKRALDAFWDRWFHDEKGHFVAGFDQFANTDEFAAKFEEHLREWLRRRTDGVSWDIATRGSPFRGLAPFDEAHASVFFGRATMVKRLAARLRSAAARGFPLVFVLGASGSGKSSLVRAGLIPHLRIAGVTEPLVARWRRAVTTPDSLSRLGDGNLLAGLVALLQGDGVLPELRQGDFANPRQLTDLLAASPESATVSLLGALDRWASAVQADEGHAQRPVTGLILVLDQFEEIFKLEDAERAALARAVSALVETGRVWLVATMRSDFYQALQGAPDWLALRDRGRSFDVTAPSAADVREIVLAPARAAGLRYEESGGRSLAEDLEREAAAPGVLPMLQSALEELFNERDAEDGLMTLASYDRLGGVQGVLAERAERVFDQLDAQAQNALSEVLGKLADFDTDAGKETPVARAALLGDFGSGTPARRLADRLLAERLLLPVSDTAGGDENAETGAWSGHVRVAHESLFLRWPRAQRQLATDRNDLELRRRLNGDAAIHAAAVTKDAKAARTLLLDGLRLAEGRDLLKRRPDLLSAQAHRFVTESDRAAKAKARRAWTIAASLIVAFSLIAALAGWSAVEANRQKQLAQTNLEVARKAANDILVDISEFYRGQNGVRPEVIGIITDKINKIMEKLGADQILTDDGLRTRWAALIAQSDSAFELGDLALAEFNANSALELARTRAGKSSPPLARADLSLSLERVARINETTGNLARARENYVESVDSWRTLVAEVNTAVVRRGLSVALQSVADIDREQGRFEQARSIYEEMLKLMRSLAGELNTPESQSDVATGLNKIALIDETLGHLSQARAAYAESLELRRTLAAKLGTPESRRGVSVSLRNVANIDVEQGYLEQAHTAYMESVELSRALVAELGTPAARLDLAGALRGLASSEEAQGHLTEAKVSYTESLTLLRVLVPELGTPGMRQMLSYLFVNVGNIDKAQGQLDVARLSYQESLELNRKLAAELDTPQARRDLSVSLDRIAGIDLMLGQPAQARAAYTEALEILRALVQEWNTPMVRRDLFIALQNVARIDSAQGQLEAARSAYAEAIEVARSISNEQSTVESHRDLVWLLRAGGSVNYKLKRISSACAMWKEASSIVNSMPGKSHASDIEKLARELGVLTQYCSN